MKRLAWVILFTTSGCTLSAQKYITAAGIRMGNEGIGISLQQRLFDHTTVEAIAEMNLKNYWVTGMIEQHNNILFSKSFNAYAGIGPSFGKDYFTDSVWVGGNFIFGVEYKVLLLPFVISADLKPSFRFGQEDAFDLGVGFSVRYVLFKDKTSIFNRNK